MITSTAMAGILSCERSFARIHTPKHDTGAGISFSYKKRVDAEELPEKLADLDRLFLANRKLGGRDNLTGNGRTAELDVAPWRFPRRRMVRLAQSASSPLYIMSFSGNLTDR